VSAKYFVNDQLLSYNVHCCSFRDMASLFNFLLLLSYYYVHLCSTRLHSAADAPSLQLHGE